MVGTDLKAESLKLMNQRDAIEAEIETIAARLNAPGAPGLRGNLVDSEGFPRADIDIMAITADRHRLAVLHNDHKVLTEKIEANIHLLHAARTTLPQKRTASGDDFPSPSRHLMPTTSETPSPVTASMADTPATSEATAMEDDTQPLAGPSTSMDGVDIMSLQPFAIIDEVTTGSPGEADGLQLEDRMLLFGEVTAGEAAISRVARTLQRSEGKEVPVVVLRMGTRVAFHVRPRVWNGRGLLGCHLRPL